MFQAAARSARGARSTLRCTQSSLAPPRTSPARRFVSTQQPAKRGRSWQGSAIRWGLAIAGIYYYNTSPVFAEQPHSNLLNPNVEAAAVDDHAGPSLDVLAARRRQEKLAQSRSSDSPAEAKQPETTSVSAVADANPSVATTGEEDNGPSPVGGAQAVEEEARSEGAFNPETGEINWDCPCLGGMAHGPCGAEFRLAFSCFVYSQEDPKGMDCIEKFQGMRDCFQRYPEVYKDELADDEELDRELEQEKQELVQRIKERREREQDDEQPASRLLEEPAAGPRVKVTRKVESKPESSTASLESAAPAAKDEQT